MPDLTEARANWLRTIAESAARFALKMQRTSYAWGDPQQFEDDRQAVDWYRRAAPRRRQELASADV